VDGIEAQPVSARPGSSRSGPVETSTKRDAMSLRACDFKQRGGGRLPMAPSAPRTAMRRMALAIAPAEQARSLSGRWTPDILKRDLMEARGRR